MQIDWWTLGLQVVNFLILVWLLHRFLVAPVRRVIQARKQETERAFDRASEKEQAGEAARQDYERKQAELEAERQELLRRTHEQLTAERDRVQSEARQRADNLVAEARSTIQAERQAALANLRTEIAGIAADLAHTLLRDSGAELDDAAVLAQLESRLAELPDGERKRLKADAAQGGAGVTVVTAKPLEAERRRRWVARLGDALGGTATVAFETEPDLIAGAELRFPHAVLRCSWADRLARAQAEIAWAEVPGTAEAQENLEHAEPVNDDNAVRR